MPVTSSTWNPTSALLGYSDAEPASSENPTTRSTHAGREDHIDDIGAEIEQSGRGLSSRRLLLCLLCESKTTRGKRLLQVKNDDERNVDLVDVMACCMDVAEDKYLWRAEDFAVAVQQPRRCGPMRGLDWRMHSAEFGLLIRLAESIRDAKGDETTESDRDDGRLTSSNGSCERDTHGRSQDRRSR